MKNKKKKMFISFITLSVALSNASVSKGFALSNSSKIFSESTVGKAYTTRNVRTPVVNNAGGALDSEDFEGIDLSKEFRVSVKPVSNEFNKEEALKKINEIRKEAYDTGVFGLKSDEYKPLKWSDGLEEFAKIRSVEASILPDHIRLNGGYSPYGENLAWNSESSVMGAINSWYNEKKEYDKNRDEYDNAINGKDREKFFKALEKVGHYYFLVKKDVEFIGISGERLDGNITTNPGSVLGRNKAFGAVAAEMSTKYVAPSNKNESIYKFNVNPNKVRSKDKNFSMGDLEIESPTKVGLENREKATAKINIKYNYGGEYKTELPIELGNWSSSNDEILTISKGGKILPKKIGNASIKISLPDGTSASKEIEVKEGQLNTQDMYPIKDLTPEKESAKSQIESLDALTKELKDGYKNRIADATSEEEINNILTEAKNKAREELKKIQELEGYKNIAQFKLMQIFFPNGLDMSSEYVSIYNDISMKIQEAKSVEEIDRLLNEATNQKNGGKTPNKEAKELEEAAKKKAEEEEAAKKKAEEEAAKKKAEEEAAKKKAEEAAAKKKAEEEAAKKKAEEEAAKKKAEEEAAKKKAEKNNSSSSGSKATSEVKDTDKYQKVIAVKSVDRISSLNREKTSIEISRKFFKNANTVIIASGKNSADALAASALANKENAPILLINSKLNLELTNEFKRLGAEKVIVVGGDKSVYSGIKNDIEKHGLLYERVAGANRMETALKIANLLNAKKKIEKAIIVNEKSTSDALAASTLASKLNGAILLVDSEGKILGANNSKMDLKSVVKQLGVKDAIAIGGEKSIPNSIMDTLHDIKTPRISGANRYDTSLEIAKALKSQTNKVMIVSGENPIDALGLGAVTGKLDAPILFVKKNEIPQKIENELKEKNIFIIGGNKVIDSSVLNMLKPAKI